MSNRFTTPSAVHVFLWNTAGKLLMIQRSYSDEETGISSSVMTVPAGHIEEGEYPKQALVREVKEEIGIEVCEVDITFESVMYRKHPDQRTNLFFSVKKYVGEPANLEPDKCDGLTFIDPMHLPANTIDYVREAFITSNKNISYLEYSQK